ncbi:hypothetical protein BGW38_001028 [Lunasporangiospora selenospora]|uniref:EF-hand domain-containing protein n=1 Tax=Lunasporangiospora selenospora TaxID=979761 RepID=A0A9P6KIE7_9FUNG|nr:hypothetical protein BGW38_001028 [Lunasporangiospora selenospora]
MHPEEIKEAFDLFDPTGTGTIQPKAFQDVVDTLGDDDLKRTIKIPTHPIDYNEFSSLMNKYSSNRAHDPEEPYRYAFQSINRDGSGRISAQELRVAIHSFLGPNALSEADIDEIIREADVSGAGGITFEEFLKVMHKSEKKRRGETVL